MKNFFDKHDYCPYSSSCEVCNWHRACEEGLINKARKTKEKKKFIRK